jgi:hypothetical protein
MNLLTFARLGKVFVDFVFNQTNVRYFESEKPDYILHRIFLSANDKDVSIISEILKKFTPCALGSFFARISGEKFYSSKKILKPILVEFAKRGEIGLVFKIAENEAISVATMLVVIEYLCKKVEIDLDDHLEPSSQFYQLGKALSQVSSPSPSPSPSPSSGSHQIEFAGHPIRHW